MITINTAKGPVKVETWDDVLERPGFIVDLDPNEHQLDAVIGRYIFGDMVNADFPTATRFMLAAIL